MLSAAPTRNFWRAHAFWTRFLISPQLNYQGVFWRQRVFDALSDPPRWEFMCRTCFLEVLSDVSKAHFYRKRGFWLHRHIFLNASSEGNVFSDAPALEWRAFLKGCSEENVFFLMGFSEGNVFLTCPLILQMWMFEENVFLRALSNRAFFCMLLDIPTANFWRDRAFWTCCLPRPFWRAVWFSRREYLKRTLFLDVL